MSRTGHAEAVVREFPLPARRRTKLHRHDRPQLTCSKSGVLTAYVAEQCWVLPPTRALWIPAGIAHDIVANTNAVLSATYLAVAPAGRRWTQVVPVVVDDLLLALLVRLERADLAEAQRRRSETVLFDVLRPVDARTVSTPMPTDSRAAAVATGLLRDPADRRTSEQWGRSVGATGRTLTRLFSAQTGLTFEQWRTAARISVALQQLAGGATVSRTARTVGYETTSAFTAAFTRELGSTPSAYFAHGARAVRRRAGVPTAGATPG